MTPRPITLLTGFLGVGKTTLLNRLLPALPRTAVLVNEFGEIGLDQLFVQAVEEDVVLLQAGCLCCTIRGDLSRALRDLAASGRPFDRVVIETTGLADPGPILQTLMSDPLLRRDFVLDAVVTLVDAAHGMATLEAQEEARRQVAVADRLVLTKTDVAPDTAALESRLRALNPVAPILRNDAPAEAIFAPGDPGRNLPWSAEEAHHHHHHDPNRHGSDIRALCLRFSQPLRWEGLASWLEMMAMTQGERMLRLKAVLNLEGEEAPVALHGVRHLFDAPRRLPAWPEGDDRSSRLVLILRGLDPEVAEAGLRAFLEAA
ncbi:CobW family GTP-binding protein [Sabulicella glaciei]|uniref:GTP-binding protein n=1 Tax=Sabulicella glaciei TaxID=2984948 RepID=A0ABT3NT15_9PROT|nr:GTP-binding protein [Roseococcus sp. MDT2-1-1]MCW8085013.1 GTP-binding protein [Roseococcus sp. MDT2-1-1]